MSKWVGGLFFCGSMLATVSAGFADDGATPPTRPDPVRAIADPGLTSTPEPKPIPTEANTAEEGFINELVSILNATHSSDAFLVTLSILQELRADAHVVVPAIIRNAERLKLFKRTDPDQPTAQQKMITECISDLLQKNQEPRSHPCSPPIAPPVSTPGAVPSPDHGVAIPPYDVFPAAAPVWPLGLPEGVVKPTAGQVAPGTLKLERPSYASPFIDCPF